MLISEVLNTALNNQIRDELANSNQYLAIATFMEGESLFLLFENLLQAG